MRHVKTMMRVWGLVLLARNSEAAVALPFRHGHRGGGRVRNSYFHIRGSAPPLDVTSLSATSRGDNSTTATLPYTAARTQKTSTLPVVYTNSPSVVSRWLSDHVPSMGGVLGFDIESVPDTPWLKDKVSFEGPATVQLATPHAALVIQLAQAAGRGRNWACGPVLEAVLGDPSIIKAGAGIDHDMLALYSHYRKMNVQSRFELGGIGSQCGRAVSLKTLTKCILGVNMIKSRKLVISNWSRVPLSDAQLAYCARDAWAGAAIMDKLAQVDEDTFGTQALVELLRNNQRPLYEVHSRAKRRKRAKKQLRVLVKGGPIPPSMPTPLRHDVTRLQRILGETAPDRLVQYNVERLGFTIHSKQ